MAVTVVGRPNTVIAVVSATLFCGGIGSGIHQIGSELAMTSDLTARLRELREKWRERAVTARSQSINPSVDSLQRMHLGAVAQISTSDADELDTLLAGPDHAE